MTRGRQMDGILEADTERPMDPGGVLGCRLVETARLEPACRGGLSAVNSKAAASPDRASPTRHLDDPDGRKHRLMRLAVDRRQRPSRPRRQGDRRLEKVDQHVAVEPDRVMARQVRHGR